MVDTPNVAAAPATPAPNQTTTTNSLTTNQPAETSNNPWSGMTLDPDVSGLLKIKGYKDVNELGKAYINAEKLIGSDKIALPGKDAKPEEMRAFYKKIGVPDKEDGYEFKKPDKGNYDDETVKWFKQAALKYGVPVKAAVGLHDEFFQHVSLREKAITEQAAVEAKQLDSQLNDEWGAASEKNWNIAKRAVAKYMPGEKGAALLNKIEEAVGGAELVKLMHRIGNDMLEDSMEKGSSGSASFVKNPAEAKAQIQKNFGDPEWMKIFTDKNNPMQKQYVQQMADLHKMAAGQ